MPGPFMIGRQHICTATGQPDAHWQHIIKQRTMTLCSLRQGRSARVCICLPTYPQASLRAANINTRVGRQEGRKEEGGHREQAEEPAPDCRLVADKGLGRRRDRHGTQSPACTNMTTSTGADTNITRCTDTLVHTCRRVLEGAGHGHLESQQDIRMIVNTQREQGTRKHNHFSAPRGLPMNPGPGGSCRPHTHTLRLAYTSKA